MTCKRSEQCNNGDICPYAKSNAYDMLGGSCYKPKAPMTNFKRITKNEETLAEFLSLFDESDEKNKEDSKTGWLLWLKHERVQESE